MGSRKKKRRNQQPPRHGWMGILLVALVAGPGGIWWIQYKHVPPSRAAAPSPPSPLTRDEQSVFAGYAGSASCRDCHQVAYDEWRKSNHGLAERPVSPGMDAAAFQP